MSAPIVSADSHIVEPPECYRDFIDPAYRDRAPYLVDDGKGGEAYAIEGYKRPLEIGLMSAAGIPDAIMPKVGPHRKFHDMHQSGWDPSTRVEDQKRDGVDAEVIYASVGMVLCNLKDPLYKDACFRAYNRWLQGYCEAAPKNPVRSGPDRRAVGGFRHRGFPPHQGSRIRRRHDAWAAHP